MYRHGREFLSLSLLTHGPLVAIRKAHQEMRASPKQCAVELRELLCQPNGSTHWPESSSQSWKMQQKAYYSADSNDAYQDHLQKARIPSSQHPLEGVVVTQSEE